MSIKERLEEQLKAAIKNKNAIVEKSLLRFVLGEHANNVKRKLPDTNEALLKTIRTTMKRNTAIGNEIAMVENNILEKMLPSTLSREKVRELAITLIREKPGQSKGFYIGTLSKMEGVEGSEAAPVIAKLLI